ncbi:Hypothetical protein Tpal_1200 [Trichococcus palustris]|uniref:Winged helix DNA-binding domain-containing protein n=1 Tax=Trichococcus palustris TaxID=140314 RepID=A0A143YI79_9LACT|nr:winged helix DNA-binding domain-containing protein [Trichococcus palustris]CZQ89971.1 Hypothetical protein Tpal_1200 [Trichococcus palustris]SFK98874.1 Winged helix DNA-binding domain-containing protein [Trichococcus palustris]
MEKRDIGHERSANQLLSGNHCDSVAETVRWMGAIQAQDYAQALWAIGARMPGTTKAEIEKAIAEKQIVRTWPMRHTIHFVAREDLRWMLDVSATRMLKQKKGRMLQLGLDEGQLEKSLELFQRELRSRGPLKRSEMRRVLESAGIDTANQRFYHILWYAAQSGLIFIGPMRDSQQTFLLVDDWAEDGPPLAREEALHRLAVRYVTSHGPATIPDFSWWAGLTLTEARTGIHSARPELFAEERDGREFWRCVHSPDAKRNAATDLRFLPNLDEYLIGYKVRSDVLPPERYAKIASEANGLFRPVLHDGQVIGNWKPAVHRGVVALTIRLAEPFKGAAKRMEEEAERYSHFIGLPMSSVKIENLR